MAVQGSEEGEGLVGQKPYYFLLGVIFFRLQMAWMIYEFSLPLE